MITEVIWFILKVILIVLLMTLMLHVTIKQNQSKFVDGMEHTKERNIILPYYIYTAVGEVSTTDPTKNKEIVKSGTFIMIR